ncbi:MAG: PA2778 family cysteine peptidase [bacterium]
MAGGARTRLRIGWGLLAAALVAGCGPTSKTLRREIQEDGAGAYLRDVPFVRQQRRWCGPAALASVAQYHGADLSQEQAAREVYLPSIQATLTVDLADCALRHGLWARAGPGTVEDVCTWVDRGVPVIALLRVPGLLRSRPHYVVVTGYHRRRRCFIAHTGTLSNRPIRFDRFARQHEAGGRFLLVACPPERVRWPLTAEGHNRLGLLFERAGQLERAEVEYREAVAADPERPLYRFNLANVLRARDDPAAAGRAYRQAIRLRPDFADAHNNLADLMLALGRHHVAHAAARRAVRIDGPRVAYYYDTLGRALLALGRYPEAAEAFRDAIGRADGAAGLADAAQAGLAEALAHGGQSAAPHPTERVIARQDKAPASRPADGEVP